ncbi:hypothetical protein OAN307_c28310 [Octadecabacter antarcticus 307]|uniref:Uncharacterized protein n=1 Tax=Octadecabacter antarcticus 307 TaxID=391626 RepID=M9RDC9_9RHOB|nr:hypothetical protein OAN307_c28310 [Octadecabacter antarcticus 307]
MFTAKATPHKPTRCYKLIRSASQATRARFCAASTCGATGLKGISLIEAFADAAYPPSDKTIGIGGNELSLDASRHKNRLNANISVDTISENRRAKLRQNLTNLYDWVSAGVHSNVTAEEAYSFFLNVYLFLGEVAKYE